VLNEPSVQVAIAKMPWPGLLGRRVLGLALIALHERATGYAWLAASNTAYGSLPEPHRRFLAQLARMLDDLADAASGIGAGGALPAFGVLHMGLRSDAAARPDDGVVARPRGRSARSRQPSSSCAPRQSVA